MLQKKIFYLFFIHLCIYSNLIFHLIKNKLTKNLIYSKFNFFLISFLTFQFFTFFLECESCEELLQETETPTKNSKISDHIPYIIVGISLLIVIILIFYSNGPSEPPSSSAVDSVIDALGNSPYSSIYTDPYHYAAENKVRAIMERPKSFSETLLKVPKNIDFDYFDD